MSSTTSPCEVSGPSSNSLSRSLHVPVVLHVDPEPILDSLRRLFQDEYCDSVLHTTLLYQNQITELDLTWSVEGTTDDDSTFLGDKKFL